MNNKIIVITLSLLFLTTFIIVLLFSLISRTNRTLPERVITPTPATQTSPTPLPNELVILNILPDPSFNTAYLPFQKITITFNDSVLPENMVIQVNPPTEIEIIQGNTPEEIYIIPISFWIRGTSEITILQATSMLGKTLEEPFRYTLITGLPTLSPEELDSDHP